MLFQQTKHEEMRRKANWSQALSIKASKVAPVHCRKVNKTSPLYWVLSEEVQLSGSYFLLLTADSINKTLNYYAHVFAIDVRVELKLLNIVDEVVVGKSGAGVNKHDTNMWFAQFSM